MQDGFVLALAGDGVAIQAGDPRGGELRDAARLPPLRADAQEIDVLALALRDRRPGTFSA